VALNFCATVVQFPRKPRIIPGQSKCRKKAQKAQKSSVFFAPSALSCGELAGSSFGCGSAALRPFVAINDTGPAMHPPHNANRIASLPSGKNLLLETAC